MTNYEKIKNMTVEEFFKFVHGENDIKCDMFDVTVLIKIWRKKCEYCVLNGLCALTSAENSPEYTAATCTAGILKWLESEVDEE